MRAAQAMFYAQPGLCTAAWPAWCCTSAVRRPPAGHRPRGRPAPDRRATWHAMSYRGHLAFPGEQMMRLSMDLSTGTAGCLLAVASVHGDRPTGLPFLPPPRGECAAHEPAPSGVVKKAPVVRRREANMNLFELQSMETPQGRGHGRRGDRQPREPAALRRQQPQRHDV